MHLCSTILLQSKNWRNYKQKFYDVEDGEIIAVFENWDKCIK